ncbi:MAG: hypothetical protein LBK67_02965 [Coriobacteriales bacterium]|nr:hypothetical protein [Coriobacteriales bacterium]
MKIIIRNESGEPAYAIRTALGGLCFELFTWKPDRVAESGRHKGKEVEAGFVSQGRYPSTLPHALCMVAECILRESPECFDVDTTQEGMDVLAGKIGYLLGSFQSELIDAAEPQATVEQWRKQRKVS